MYEVDIHYDEPFYTSPIFDFYFKDARIGVFDIETTGLDAKRNKFVLGGLLIPDGDGVRLRQFFSEGGHEESEILDIYTEALRETDILVSYNGNHFDIPFTNGRLAHHHRRETFSGILSFDLYQIVKKFSGLKKVLPNLKQKTVENYMGLWSDRKDQISGADSVFLYHEYMATGSSELLEFILLHNRDDLLQLARLLAVLAKMNLHEVMANTGFPTILNDAAAFAEKITLRKSSLEISGWCRGIPFDMRRYENGFACDFLKEEGSFFLKLPCISESGVTYVDLKLLDMDYSPLTVFPEFESDFLVLKNGDEVAYGPINYLIRYLLLSLLEDASD